MEKSREMEAAIQVAKAVYEAIKAFGSAGVPSGHLYAVVAAGLQLQDQSTYDALVDLLVRSGLVRRASNHRLIAA